MRQAIWDIAAIDLPPNYVTITNVGDTSGLSRGWWHAGDIAFRVMYKAKAAYKIPALLQTNGESRLRAKKHLTTAFHHSFPGNPVSTLLKNSILSSLSPSFSTNPNTINASDFK